MSYTEETEDFLTDGGRLGSPFQFEEMPRVRHRSELRVHDVAGEDTNVLRGGVFVELAVEELEPAANLGQLAEVAFRLQRQDLFGVERDAALIFLRQAGELTVVQQLQDTRQVLAYGVVQ